MGAAVQHRKVSGSSSWMKNKKYVYEMCGVKLKSVECAKDPLVFVPLNLKFSQQCKVSANKANRLLGFIKRNFSYKHKDVILTLCNSPVRPHLEYAVQLWPPRLVKDIVKLESGQHRVTKTVFLAQQTTR